MNWDEHKIMNKPCNLARKNLIAQEVDKWAPEQWPARVRAMGESQAIAEIAVSPRA